MTQPGMRKIKTRVWTVTILMGLTGLLLLGSGSIGLVTDSWAQTASPGAAVTLHEGEVTGVGARTLQINGRDYPLDPAVIITDSSGRARDLKEIARGDFVQFHLKRERIDQLILMLPS